MATLLLLLACATPDCPAFEDIAVTDPDGLAEDGEVDRIQAAIDDFARWTGRDGVCVEEVRLMDEEGLEGAAGAYFVGRELVGVKAGGSVESMTRHELCHALDVAEGDLSLQNPDLFPPEAVDVSESYPTEDARIRESFAGQCAYGPRSTALIDAMEESCGEDLGGARQRFLNEEVWAAWTDTGSPAEGTVPVAIERVAVEPYLLWNGPVAGGSDVYVTSEEGLLRLDVATGRIAATIAVPEGAQLVGGDAGPLVVVPEEGAWQVVGDVLEARAFPTLDYVHSGAVRDGEAWVYARGTDVVDRFLRVDLSTGEAETIPLPEGVRPLWLNPGPGALWGVGLDDADERILVGFDLATRAWSTAAVPGGWTGTDVVPETDGPLVGVWTDALAMGREYDFTGLGVVDPTDGRWWIAEDACGATDLSMSYTLLWVDDGPVVWEWSNGWEEGDALYGRGHALTRVRIGE